ncbi:uncharacterized protein [Procambarus clarkii]|uniref:uncharacterized protein n=1 Tax=Procambarus clarkii TaxID=6728 RepID=UPI001E672EB4|nr:uncharacterized protein LOC123755359 [Procambarus clarkii]XP_045593863.1 uncharacterized protein LOC123755359 [Procambarus clarkii]XP_045593864.1 uncharacterized protein LOC123755359 [Procambarus clarkii]XP_045593865.1 uncharacterized protein LOC123755359 [Procambarus clarkii]XP_045593866.1 uncharacterized protein LOC123755359 [Procambarus clarkii]
MPLLKPVDRLEKLCSWKIANHMFSVFSSWYKGEKGGKCTIGLENTRLDNRNVVGNQINDGILDETFNILDYGGSMQVDWHYIEPLTYSDVYESNKEIDYSRAGYFTPVPEQYRTVNAVTQWLAREVRNFLTCNLAPRFHEEILVTVINVIASRIEIPRPKEKIRVYEEDLDFLNTLGFLLSSCLRCLLTKGVAALDLSHVSHLLKRWKLLCWEGQTIKRSGEVCESPYFDIFSYAFDADISGLRTLRFIKLPHFVHNSFVRKIAYLCPNLKILILRCSADCANPKYNVPVVTNVEVLYGDVLFSRNGQIRLTPGCRDLVTLALPEGVETLDITSDAIEILACMPNLEYLVGAPMIYVTEEFEDVVKLPIPQKLTNFHHGAYPKSNWPSFVYEESMQEPDPEYLSKVFTQVKEVGIYAPTEVTEKVLKSFSKAQDITIFTDDFDVHGKYLKNLTTLDINVGYQEEWPILISLCQTSPKLEQLTLRSFSLQMSGSLDQKPKFPLLHTLKFHGQNVLHDDALLTFIRGCPLLTTFVLSMITDEDGEGQLDDDILLRAAPLLSNIHKFIYKVQSALRTMDGVPSSLTMKSCDALISACPQLAYIGQLETWKVTRSEIVALQEKIRKKNWDLEII